MRRMVQIFDSFDTTNQSEKNLYVHTLIQTESR